ncbi:hypothetical protein PGC35_14235 [Psychrobacillus sp. PGGUH221]|uniref:hypothetical protein n=1 Tax=Psychrobacillus sp. PGGUH221 TaxID=3020058 RepID=UPI0035C6CD43
MSKHSKRIENYGISAIDTETSPFEAVDMLHVRSKIETVINELTNEERLSLYFHDMKLIKNAKQMSIHIGEVYDFSLSDQSINEWWWHLDQVADGEITFNLIPEMKPDMGI